jgi:S-adenosylmethionine hydrolase
VDRPVKRWLSAALAVALIGCAAWRAPVAPVVFMSDFGTNDDSVAICKGVMLGIAPELSIVDLTHEVPPYSIPDGARFLAGAAPYYPAGTVFVAVVDPGVGGKRRAMVGESGRGQYFVLPDNGLITLVAERDGLRSAREIVNWLPAEPHSSTFHGRDVFAPTAARLARGESLDGVGPPITDPVRLDLHAVRASETGLEGEVVGIDGRYGNVITNLDAPTFQTLGYTLGETVRVRIQRKDFRLPFVRTFSDVPIGRELLYVDSRGRMALAVNRGNFARRHAIAAQATVVIPRKRR